MRSVLSTIVIGAISIILDTLNIHLSSVTVNECVISNRPTSKNASEGPPRPDPSLALRAGMGSSGFAARVGGPKLALGF
jgi:hypothetical protein